MEEEIIQTSFRKLVSSYISELCGYIVAECLGGNLKEYIYNEASVSVGLTNIEGDMRHIEDKTDNVWLLKRRSICLPGNPSKYSSFALSPSAHSSRDFQQNGE